MGRADAVGLFEPADEVAVGGPVGRRRAGMRTTYIGHRWYVVDCCGRRGRHRVPRRSLFVRARALGARIILRYATVMGGQKQGLSLSGL